MLILWWPNQTAIRSRPAIESPRPRFSAACITNTVWSDGLREIRVATIPADHSGTLRAWRHAVRCARDARRRRPDSVGARVRRSSRRACSDVDRNRDGGHEFTTTSRFQSALMQDSVARKECVSTFGAVERASCVRDRCPESTPRSSSRAQLRTPDPTARRRGARGRLALRTFGGHARSRRRPWRLCGRSLRPERR